MRESDDDDQRDLDQEVLTKNPKKKQAELDLELEHNVVC